MKTLYGFLICCIALIFACGDEVKDTTGTPEEIPATKPSEKPEVPDDRIPLLLNGLYATSTHSGTNVRKAFDRDQKSSWQSMMGAGPDEGIMLYFSEETFIQSIRVLNAEGENLVSIDSITIYGNGAPINDVAAGETGVVDQKLWNVYLRFSTFKNVEKSDRYIESDFYNEISLVRFTPDAHIGIHTIVIEGEEGEFKIQAPPMLAGDVDATSTLKEKSFAYDPSLLFDARKEFVWVEGEKGNGEGVKLRFEFEEEVSIAGLQIWNGYQRSDSHFKSNARLKSFNFGSTDGRLKTYNLKDEQGNQKVKLDTVFRGKIFELEIKSAYKGWSYKDLAISEILFFDEADALFGIQSPRSEMIRNTILQKSKGTILEELLDSRVFNEYSSDEFPMRMTRSAILRSDGTFVLYSSEEDEVDKIETIADGNWEINTANAESATITVFGKLLDFSLLEMYYAGEGEVELGRIFKDKITIKGNTIKGEKLVNVIEF